MYMETCQLGYSQHLCAAASYAILIFSCFPFFLSVGEVLETCATSKTHNMYFKYDPNL